MLLGRTCNLGKVAKFASHWNAKGKQGLKAHLVGPGTVAGTEAVKQALNGKFENAEQKKGVEGYLKAYLEKEFAWVDEIDKCASRLKDVRQRITTPLDAESRDDIGNHHEAVIRLAAGGAHREHPADAEQYLQQRPAETAQEVRQRRSRKRRHVGHESPDKGAGKGGCQHRHAKREIT